MASINHQHMDVLLYFFTKVMFHIDPHCKTMPQISKNRCKWVVSDVSSLIPKMAPLNGLEGGAFRNMEHGFGNPVIILSVREVCWGRKPRVT